jgi:hypothetical protein
MAYKETRRLVKFGAASRGITLPKPWLDYHGDKALKLTLLGGGGILVLAPQGYEETARRLLDKAESEAVRP